MARWRRHSEGPQPLADSLAAVSGGIRRVDLLGVGAVSSVWEEVIGQPLASHATPAKLVGETLTVLVDRPVWGSQITLLADEICSRISNACGVSITTLEVSVSRG